MRRTSCPPSESRHVCARLALVEEPARDPVAAAAASRPTHPALIAASSVLTWAELDARVDAAARRLVMLARPGERVPK